MVDRQRPGHTEFAITEEQYPENERWVRLSCPNDHVEEIENFTASIRWYCPDCGSRRSVETNHISPETTHTDKV